MEYKEADNELDDELDTLDLIDKDTDFSTDDLDEGSELPDELLDDHKEKGRQQTRRTLKVRRAIEDYLEEKRLREDLYYLSEEDFPEEK